MIKELETIAIHDISLRDPEYFARKVCRYYSEKFHTPLIDVYSLPWGFVLTNYLEHIVESNNSREDIIELAIDICYPELRKNQEDVIEDRIRQLEIENIQKGFGKNPKKEKAKVIEKIEKEKIKELSSHNKEPEIKMESTSFAHLNEEMEEDNE